MAHPLRIACPHCQTILILDRISGEVLDVREPLVAESSGDRFKDAVEKVKHSSQEAEAKFQKSQEAEKTKKQALDDLFTRSLEQVKREGPVAPEIKDIDLD